MFEVNLETLTTDSVNGSMVDGNALDEGTAGSFPKKLCASKHLDSPSGHHEDDRHRAWEEAAKLSKSQRVRQKGDLAPLHHLTWSDNPLRLI